MTAYSDDDLKRLIVRSPGRTLDAICPYPDCHQWITSAGASGAGLTRVVEQLRSHMYSCPFKVETVDFEQDLRPFVPKGLDEGPDEVNLTTYSNRTCQRCKGAMPNRMSRQRDGKGDLVCDSCKANSPAKWATSGAVFGMSQAQQVEMDKRQAEALASIMRIATNGGPMQRLAHDSGDNALLNHCAFCGSGAIFARSDNSTECDYCHTVFTVQVQPQQPFMPQTIDGVPSVPPGMPGGAETEMSAPADPSVAEDDEGVAADPLGGDDPAAPGAKPNPFAKGPGAKPAPAPSSDEKGGGGSKPPWLEKKKSFRTTTGATLTGEDYMAHLALAHATDRSAVLDVVRTQHVAVEASGSTWQCKWCSVEIENEDGDCPRSPTGKHVKEPSSESEKWGSKTAAETEFACPACNGSGGLTESEDCPVCSGQGMVSWAKVEEYRDHLHSSEDPRAETELADVERRYASRRTAAGTGPDATAKSAKDMTDEELVEARKKAGEMLAAVSRGGSAKASDVWVDRVRELGQEMLTRGLPKRGPA